MGAVSEISHSDEMVYALEQIDSLPLAFDHPLFRQYPAMKMGNPLEIAFFSQQLAVLANSLVKSSHTREEWVITAPPYFQIPAAANFLARQVQELLHQQDTQVSLHELRLIPPETHCSAEEFSNTYNYSKNNVQQRLAERERVQQMLDTRNLAAAFSGKHVIIINDINVTGTQQHFIHKTMQQVQAKYCYWIYIFNVDKNLSLVYPEIEHLINTSQLTDLDSYARLLGNPQTLHTARCISRLFNESPDNFNYLIQRLEQAALNKIHLLAQQEGKYNSSIFKNKMDLLAGRATSISPDCVTLEPYHV